MVKPAAPDRNAPVLERRESALQTRIARLQNRLREETPEGERRRLLEDNLKALETELDALNFEAQLHTTPDGTGPRPAFLDLLQAQELLEPDMAVVDYVIISRRILGLVITDASYHVVSLPVAPRVVAAQVQNYLELLQQGRGWAPVSRRLYTELMAPLEDDLGGGIRQIVFIPDGPLHALPFDTLMSPSGNGRMLLDSFRISYAPSVTVLARLMQDRERDGPASVLLFADPALPGASREGNAAMRRLYNERGLHLPPAPGSRFEARAVARLAGQGSAIRRDTGASEEELKNLHLERYDVLHFATHALVNHLDPMSSALVLAPGSRLPAPQDPRTAFCRHGRSRVFISTPTWWCSQSADPPGDPFCPARACRVWPGPSSTPAPAPWWAAYGMWTTGKPRCSSRLSTEISPQARKRPQP